MLFFVWENSGNVKLLENNEFENEIGFGKFAGMYIPTHSHFDSAHYYIYVGF